MNPTEVIASVQTKSKPKSKPKSAPAVPTEKRGRGRPQSFPNEPTKAAGYTLPITTIDRVTAGAEVRDININILVNRALLAYLRKDGTG